MKYIVRPIFYVLRTIFRICKLIAMAEFWLLINVFIIIWHFNTDKCWPASDILDDTSVDCIDININKLYYKSALDFILKRNLIKE